MGPPYIVGESGKKSLFAVTSLIFSSSSDLDCYFSFCWTNRWTADSWLPSTPPGGIFPSCGRLCVESPLVNTVFTVKCIITEVPTLEKDKTWDFTQKNIYSFPLISWCDNAIGSGNRWKPLNNQRKKKHKSILDKQVFSSHKKIKCILQATQLCFTQDFTRNYQSKHLVFSV